MTDAKPKTPPERHRSRLAREADDAARKLLLEELTRHAWQLTATATALEMGSASEVIRAIRRLGLSGEYETARREGLVKPGPRPRDDQT